MIGSRKSLTILAALSLTLVAAGLPAQRVRNHFDSDALTMPPPYFDFMVVGAAAPASWKVLSGENVPSLPRYLSQVVKDRPADSVAIALRRNVSFEDGLWSLAVRRGQSRAGIAFRFADESHFRVLLVDNGSGDARLVAYENGKPSELARGQAKLDRDWSFLEVETKGPQIKARWNGEPLLEAADPSPVAGRGGAATAGPGIAGFDEFILDPAGK
jgi:hypothetical protein